MSLTLCFLCHPVLGYLALNESRTALVQSVAIFSEESRTDSDVRQTHALHLFQNKQLKQAKIQVYASVRIYDVFHICFR